MKTEIPGQVFVNFTLTNFLNISSAGLKFQLVGVYRQTDRQTDAASDFKGRCVRTR